MFADIQKYVKIVRLFPNEILTKDKISKVKSSCMTLKSNGDLSSLIFQVKTVVDPRLTNLPLTDLTLYSSQNLTAFYNPSMKLSELSDDVGSNENPLVFTFPAKLSFDVDLTEFYRSYLERHLCNMDCKFL